MEYGAIDLHTRYSEIQLVDEAGVVTLSRRVATRPEALAGVFEGRPRLRVLLETGTESEWVATLLESWGHEAIVADPNYAPMYGERRRRIKTDRRDVAALAEANRLGLFRVAHRTSAAQRQVRSELTVRTTLVRMRTQAINVVRALLRARGYRLASGQASTFVARVERVGVPAALGATLAPLLTHLTALGPAIAAADRAALTRAKADPVTRRLMTAPGVGPLTALHVRATLDRVERFRDAAAVSSYLGLVPREYSSGERQRRGAITKTGASDTRAILVQASWVIWRIKRGPGTALATWAHRLAARRGRRVAIVAVARRLTRILFALWRDETDFVEPAAVRQAA
jgi:transposase